MSVNDDTDRDNQFNGVLVAVGIKYKTHKLQEVHTEKTSNWVNDSYPVDEHQLHFKRVAVLFYLEMAVNALLVCVAPIKLGV